MFEAKQRKAKNWQFTRNQTQGPRLEQGSLVHSIPGDCLSLMSSCCQLLPAFHFVLFYLIPSLVPRPRPAFHRLQYRKAGRVWYLFSCEQDIIGKWQKFQKAGRGLGTGLPHTIKHGKFSGMRWYAGVATNITCRSVYDQLGSKIIVVKRCSWLPWLPPSEALDGLTHSEDTPFQSLPRLTSNSHFGWSLP